MFEPSKGVRENVVVLDLKSLYPMAMMTINASTETKDPDGELRAPNGIRFRKQPDGLTRSIIAELLKERDEKKNAAQYVCVRVPAVFVYDMQQNVLKVIMNTYYGVSGYTRFRLFDREIGSAVTSVGRAIIEHTRREIEKQGYKVIYGDTDSCMVQLPPPRPGADDRNGPDNEKNASTRVILPLQRTNSTPIPISSPSSSRRSMPGSSRPARRNAMRARLSGKRERTCKETDIVGFEIKRSDTPQITKIVQMKVMEQILGGEGYQGIKALSL